MWRGFLRHKCERARRVQSAINSDNSREFLMRNVTQSLIRSLDRDSCNRLLWNLVKETESTWMQRIRETEYIWDSNRMKAEKGEDDEKS